MKTRMMIIMFVVMITPKSSALCFIHGNWTVQSSLAPDAYEMIDGLKGSFHRQVRIMKYEWLGQVLFN